MTSTKNRLIPNTQEVAAKVIDGEAILINLSNGIYYSLDGVGACVWEHIELGYGPEDLVRAVTARYDVSVEQAEKDVQALSAELIKEDLVIESPDTPAQLMNGHAKEEQELPYEAPILNVYRDMDNLLALDPPMPGLADMAWKDPDDEATG
jgi:hypothetical protein